LDRSAAKVVSIQGVHEGLCDLVLLVLALVESTRADLLDARDTIVFGVTVVLTQVELVIARQELAELLLGRLLSARRVQRRLEASELLQKVLVLQLALHYLELRNLILEGLNLLELLLHVLLGG
jgi:hypothetical protein